jgi:hypothetical protein
MAEFRAPGAPLVVHLMGRWFQGLGAVVLTIGLGAVQQAVKFGALVTTAALIGIAFLALSTLLFVVGHFVIEGRRWAWQVGIVVAGAVLVYVVYMVAGLGHPLWQRAAVTLVTLVLFGVPVAALGLPASRQFFAKRQP